VVRTGKIISVVSTLLKRNGVLKPPVPVERIAEGLGLDIRYAPFVGDLSGALVRKGGEAYIGINSLHHPNRQRFTVAHELGHFMLHRGMKVHVDKDFHVNWRDDDSSRATSRDEIEANGFAAELLMPTDFIVRDLQDFGRVGRISRELASLMAKRYRVSLQAMQIKLGSFGFIPPD
jgi:Zn-dependent peptidase ImmA (M78 family)